MLIESNFICHPLRYVATTRFPAIQVTELTRKISQEVRRDMVYLRPTASFGAIILLIKFLGRSVSRVALDITDWLRDQDRCLVTEVEHPGTYDG